MSVRTLARLYKGQLRVRPLPELLALFGVAAGVALLFAVQVANKSVTGSFEQLSHGIYGKATLEMAARGPRGFSQRLYEKVNRLPGVRIAAPVVERRIAVSGPKGRRALTLVGFDDRLEALGGRLVTSISRRRDVASLNFDVTAPVAQAIGVRPGDEIAVEAGERRRHLPLGGVAGSKDIGSLIHSPVATAQLSFAQEVAGMSGRLTRILVAPFPGRESQVRAGLEHLSAGKVNVRASRDEAKLLQQAATPDRQPSALFSAISLVVGILLAYNAMLLTLADRRRMVASLHLMGASNGAIVALLAFGAVVVGVTGSVLGIFLGDQLSRHVLHQVPSFLTAAFAIGNQRVVTLETVILSVAGGTLAALAAAARPAAELLRVGAEDAFSERDARSAAARSSKAQARLAWGGVAVVVLAVGTAIAIPATTMFAAGGVVAGMLMMLPVVIAFLLRGGLKLARNVTSPALRVSMGELAATPVRATALAGIGALAVFAILSITGPTRDIERGMDRLTNAFFGNADLWVTPGQSENTTGTFSFDQREAVRRVKRLPQVAKVRTYRGSFLDFQDRRVWVIAESPASPHLVVPSQVVDGNADDANRHLRQGGWAALTQTTAAKHNLRVGESFMLPTPTGSKRLRLAATVTNYGWPAGVLVINSDDYAHMWGSTQASAVEIDLAPGVAPQTGKRAIQGALGSTTTLRVQTIDERRAEIAAKTREGLARLNQIAAMVIIAAILAVAAAVLGSIWQRRDRLWSLVSLGMGSGQLARTIFLETGVILLLGCVVGIAFGSLGQAVADRWLRLTAAYSVPYLPAWQLALTTLGLAVVFGALAASVPIRFMFSRRRALRLSSE